MIGKVPAFGASLDDAEADDPHAPSVSAYSSVGLGRQGLLERIAHTIRMPRSSLLVQSSLIDGPCEAVDRSFELEQECQQLVEAYRRIRDAEMRRRYLELIQLSGEAA